MKKHTIYGCDILDKFKQEDNEFFRYCYDICRYHHERYDGKGYPDRLKGDKIPIWAQVVSIVDVFDALVSKRVYKDAYPVEEAERMIVRGECGVFSPEIIDCFQLAKPELRKATEAEFSFV
jgi:putative two-component system response regulator